MRMERNSDQCKRTLACVDKKTRTKLIDHEIGPSGSMWRGRELVEDTSAVVPAGMDIRPKTRGYQGRERASRVICTQQGRGGGYFVFPGRHLRAHPKSG